MVVVCPQCQMLYEVEDEYMLQGQPVMCPTCNVQLIAAPPESIPPAAPVAAEQAFEQATEPPAELSTEQAAEPTASTTDIDEFSLPPPPPAAAQQDDQGTSAASATTGSTAGAPPAWGAGLESASWGGWSDPLAVKSPASTLPVETPALLPEMGSLTQSAAEIIPSAAPQSDWGASLLPGGELPEAPAAVVTPEEIFGSSASKLEMDHPPSSGFSFPPADVSPSGYGAMSAPDIIPEAAPVADWGASSNPQPVAPAAGAHAVSFETPTWPPADTAQAPGTMPVAPSAPAPTLDIMDLPKAPTSRVGPPSADLLAGKDDWATAAARWAASGFSKDQMPDFVREHPSEPPPAAPQTLPEPQGVSFTLEPPTIPPPVSAAEPKTILTPPPLPAVTAEDSFFEPPPLPSSGAASETPPLLGKRKSTTYVMRGSGEGTAEESPWQAPTSGQAVLPISQPGRGGSSQLTGIDDLPTITPDQEVTSEDNSVEVDIGEKPSRAWLWIVLTLILLGAGGAAAYFLLTQTTDKAQTAPGVDAGSASTGTVLPVSDGDSLAANTQDEKGQGTKAADAGVAEGTVPPPVGADGDSPGEGAAAAEKPQTPKDKPVAVRDPPKRAPEQAKKFYQLGNDFIKKGKYKEAIKEFEKALVADPTLALAHRGMGIAYAQMHQNVPACKEYRTYLKMIPPDSKEVPALRQIIKDCR